MAWVAPLSLHTDTTVPDSVLQVIRMVSHPYVRACVTAEKTVLSAYGFMDRSSCLSLSLTSWHWLTSCFSNSALPNAQPDRQSTSSSSLMEDQEEEKVGQGQSVFFLGSGPGALQGKAVVLLLLSTCDPFTFKWDHDDPYYLLWHIKWMSHTESWSLLNYSKLVWITLGPVHILKEVIIHRYCNLFIEIQFVLRYNIISIFFTSVW